MRSFSLCAPVSIEIEACRRTGLLVYSGDVAGGLGSEGGQA